MALFRLVRPRLLAYFVPELGLVLAVVFGLATWTLRRTPEGAESHKALTVLLVSTAFCAVLLLTQVSSLGERTNIAREIVVFSLISVVLGVLYFTAVWALSRDNHWLSARLALEGAVAVPAAIALWRWLSVRFNLFNATRERLVIVGTGETARQVCRWIVANHANEFGVLGFADEKNGREGTVLAMGVRIQTDYESLVQYCIPRVDRVLVALDEKRGKLPVRQLMELRLRGIEVEDATSYFERISGKLAVETMLPSWLIFSEGFKSTPLRAFLKKSVDIVFSVALLVLTAPIMLATAVLIRLDSRGPILYRQERLGLDGRKFYTLKFRSMRHGAERKSGPTWTIQNDPRITRVGQLIRRLRIDELPQLINVLRGEMSFVGPRPEREYFVRRLEQKIAYYSLRMTVRPGITGWAQVEYGYGANEEDALEKLKYDLYYIKNITLLFDLWIVLKTIKVVFFGKGR